MGALAVMGAVMILSWVGIWMMVRRRKRLDRMAQDLADVTNDLPRWRI